MPEVGIGEACIHDHISFDFEGGGCGGDIYADIVIGLRNVTWRADDKAFRSGTSRFGEKALRNAAHEIETALKYWIEAGRPGYEEQR